MEKYSYSSRRTPCPICGRTKDDDCRWNDEVILCHTGTDLKPGDTVVVGDKEWAFIHHKGGFSGMAAVFKPHIPRPASSSPAQPTPMATRVHGLSKAQWDSVLTQFHQAFETTWRLPDLYACSPSELDGCIATITDAQKKAAAIRPWLSQVWRLFPDLDQTHRQRIESELKHTAFIAEDLRSFQQNELGAEEGVA